MPAVHRSPAGVIAAAALALAALTGPAAAAAPDPVAAAPSTRAQLAELAADTLAGRRGGPPQAPGRRFTDVAGHPLAAGIEAAAADHLVVGYPDGSFRPDAPASTQHVETVKARLVDRLVEEGLLQPGDPLPDPVVATFATAAGSFRVVLDQPAAIDLVAGAEPGTPVGIPNGRLLAGDGGVNTGRSWHLVDVEIVEMTMEVCDATADYVDEVGVDGWYDQHGDRFCPWDAVYLGSEPHLP